MLKVQIISITKFRTLRALKKRLSFPFKIFLNLIHSAKFGECQFSFLVLYLFHSLNYEIKATEYNNNKKKQRKYKRVQLGDCEP